MIEQYAVAALYLVPVLVAALVAFFVTREPHDEPQVRRYESPVTTPSPGAAPLFTESPGAASMTAASLGSPEVERRRVPGPRQPAGSERRTGLTTYRPAVGQKSIVHADRTLFHAALSAHVKSVALVARRAPAPAVLPAASVRRPTRHGRRASHRCAGNADAGS